MTLILFTHKLIGSVFAGPMKPSDGNENREDKGSKGFLQVHTITCVSESVILTLGEPQSRRPRPNVCVPGGGSTTGRQTAETGYN